MKYIQVDIATSHSGVEAIVGELLALGVTDTVVDDPMDALDIMEKKESYEWDYIDDDVVDNLNRDPKVMVFFEDSEENRALAEKIRESMSRLALKAAKGEFGEGADFGSLEVSAKIEDDILWKDKWKDYFKPAQISESIVVKPTWEEYENKDNKLVIEIDPGMAFGTGTHETTSMCVKMLEKYMDRDFDVLDVGCGSGILSIAAALLGARDVCGIDIDPIAVEVAEENLKLNKVDDIAKAMYGDLTKGVNYKADIVVANLMADLVMMLAGDAARHMKENALFISSGILTVKESVVAGCLEENGFEIVEIMEDDQWCCIVAKVRQK